MKKIALLLSLAWSAFALGQRHVNTQWRNEVNSVFSHIELGRVPNNVLLDYAFEFTDVTAYNGTLTDSTAINVDVFSDIYSTLYMGNTVQNNPSFPKLDQIAANWVNERLKTAAQHNTVTLSGLYYKYSRISPLALQENKISVVNESYYEYKYVNGVWQDPFETLNAIAFSPPISSFNKRTFDVVLPQTLMLSNSLSEIDKIEFDGQDGTGYHELRYDQPVTLQYMDDGVYKWMYRITLSDRSVLYSYNFFSVKGALSSDATVTDIEGATLNIDYVPGNNGQLRRPFIVVEGFDTGHISQPETEGGDRSLSDFYSDIFYSNKLRSLLYSNGTQEYDVIYVDWERGTADLRDNSVVLENIINWVNENKIGNEEIVILGQSMGGVISRYTLARMENDNDPRNHGVRTFISHDAPHQGSNTLLSGQMFVRHMYNEYLDTPLYQLGEDVLPVIYTLLDSMASLLNNYTGSNLSVQQYVSPEDLLTLQDTPAAVQMNYYWFTPSEEVDTSLHEQWQAELENMGYPQQSYNIAVSNGNECGGDQGFIPGAVLADMHKEGNKAFFRRVLWGLAVPLIGILTNDIELTLLGILPGSSRFYFDFELKALPDIGASQRNIYNGKIRYKKKFLWIIGIWHTLTERSKAAPNYTLPFDSYPGGNFDISAYGEDIPNIFPDFNFNYATYGFIPTVSALDVKRNDAAPAPVDYLKVYGFNTMPETSLSSPFDNFLVEDRVNAPYNGEHISFQSRTGNWIANEIDAIPGNDEVNDCRIRCVNEIAGPERICDLGGTFSVSEGADSYLWNVIGGDIVTVTSPLNESVLTVERNGSKSGWVQIGVRINSEDCDIDDWIITKSVYVGAPTVQSITYINTSSGGGNAGGPGSGDGDSELPDNGPVLPMNPTLVNDGCEVYLEMNYTPGINEITDIEWEKVTSDISWSRDIVDHSGRYVYLYPTCNKLFTFRIRTKSDCGGWSHWQEFTHDITACTDNCGSSNGIATDNFYISPVPAVTELNIGIRNNHTWSFPPSTTLIPVGGNPYTDPENGGSVSTGPYTHPALNLNVSFYNNAAVLVLQTTTIGIPAQVNVASLPQGSYVMVIEYQGQIESHTIVIN
ncbi:hypothetical protein GN157_13000 [Flavobacterium rakeshii]|uniref:GPI inositol-deacylase PGAP1-like alpha/beta domain-containing protein n=1 Tax=Flavobacterium rakeshii TaxID=1038845 RepID=A0A6N8HG06_9FLAO|nr:hypothetical protein [Flavobacterium rakeshii]MUV04628.1 hypothetical protein [Flavobacterium rakeshii]